MAQTRKEVDVAVEAQTCSFPTNGTFKCRCDGSFTVLNKLRDHLRCVHLGKHADKMLQCKCGDHFSSIAGLVQHRTPPPRKIHSLRNCSKCKNAPYATLNDVLNHFSRCHSEDSVFLQEVFKCEEEGCEHAVGATSITEFKEHDMRYHSDLDERPFQCQLCPMAYKIKSSLKSHMEKIHPAGGQQKCSKYICPVPSCSKGFGNINAFEKHVNGSHPGQTMPHLLCPICAKQFTHRTSFGTHLMAQHKTSSRKLKQKKCPLCDHQGEDLMAHFKSQHDSLKGHPNTCIRCGTVVKFSIYRHIYAFHKDDQEVLKWYFTCGIENCKEFTTTMQQLLEHRRRQHGNDLLQNKKCSICDQSFTITARLMSHYQTSHPSETDAVKKLLTCQICKKEHGSLTELRHHRLSHYNDKVKCRGCPSKVIRQCLHRHVEQMHADQPHVLKMYFGCKKSWCHEHFKTYRQYRKHAISHSFGKKKGTFLCTTCKRPFLTDKTRLVHETIDHRLPELLFKCPHTGCGEISPNVKSYKRHMSTTHEKEDPRPNRCPVCLKLNNDPCVLMSHMIRFHFSSSRKKVSALMCQFPGCQQIFTNKEEKKKHATMEHSTILEMEKACNFCNTMIGSREMVMLHIMEDHKEDNAFIQGMLTCNIDNCNETFRNLDHLRRHRQTHGPRYEKLVCPIKPNRKHQLMKCDVEDCPITVQGMKAWLLHRAEHDGVVQFHECKLCHKLFHRLCNLTRHIRQCTGKLRANDLGKRKCDRAGCNLVKYTDAEMTLHIMDHIQSGDSYQCWICGTLLISLQQLVGHLRLDQCDVKNIRFKNTKNHVFEVVGAYASDTSDLKREWRFTCNLCPKKFQTRRELLIHVDKNHHNRYKIKGPSQTGLDQSQHTKKCGKCHLLLPCSFALMIHRKLYHPNFNKKSCLKNPHIVRRWCTCCNFVSPSRALIQPQVFSLTKTEETEAIPVVTKCLACDFSTRDLDKAFLHIRDNLDPDYWNNLKQPTGPALLTANNYDKCRECKLIFHNEYEYLSHLEYSHYATYIAELTRLHPYMENSATVIHYRNNLQNYNNRAMVKQCRVRIARCDSRVKSIIGPSTSEADPVKETPSTSKGRNPNSQDVTARRNPKRKCTIKVAAKKKSKTSPIDDVDGSGNDSDPDYVVNSLITNPKIRSGRKEPPAKLKRSKNKTRQN